MNFRTGRAHRAGLALLLCLAACDRGVDSKPVAQAGFTPSASAAAAPAIQKIYDSTCKTCHSVPASGAPQRGDAQAWAPRVAQGRDIVLNHIINGYQKMPPMGMCMQCSEDEFAALTEYMSGTQLK